jgi:hypothetical protein
MLCDLAQHDSAEVAVIDIESEDTFMAGRWWLVCIAALLILAGIGATAAKALWPAGVVAHPAKPETFDSDYVQGLIKYGIVKMPGPVAPIAVK